MDVQALLGAYEDNTKNIVVQQSETQTDMIASPTEQIDADNLNEEQSSEETIEQIEKENNAEIENSTKAEEKKEVEPNFLEEKETETIENTKAV